MLFRLILPPKPVTSTPPMLQGVGARSAARACRWLGVGGWVGRTRGATRARGGGGGLCEGGEGGEEGEGGEGGDGGEGGERGGPHPEASGVGSKEISMAETKAASMFLLAQSLYFATAGVSAFKGEVQG